MKTERKIKIEDKCQLIGNFGFVDCFCLLIFLNSLAWHADKCFIHFPFSGKKRDKERRDRKEKDPFKIKQKKKKKKKKKSKLHCKIFVRFLPGSMFCLQDLKKMPLVVSEFCV